MRKASESQAESRRLLNLYGPMLENDGVSRESDSMSCRGRDVVEYLIACPAKNMGHVPVPRSPFRPVDYTADRLAKCQKVMRVADRWETYGQGSTCIKLMLRLSPVNTNRA